MDPDAKDADVMEDAGPAEAANRKASAKGAADSQYSSRAGGEARASASPTAIERQIAYVAAALNAERRIKVENDRPRLRFTNEEDIDEPRFPLWMIVGGALLLAGGSALLLPSVRGSMEDSYHAAVQRGRGLMTPSTVAVVAPAKNIDAVAETKAAQERPDLIASPPASTPPAASAKAPEKVTPVETPQPVALSIPIENISMRDGPELFEQLVGIYRSQLAADPANTTARDALGRLRDKSLAELDAVISQADAPVALTSLGMVSRLFPELTESPRYQSLAASVNKMQLDVARQQPAAINSEAAAATPQPVAAATMPAAPANPPAVPASAQPSVKQAARESEKPVERAVSSKPDVRILAATPGRLEAGRFIPAEGGKVFLLVINYRNFMSRNQEGDAQLEIRLGNTGDRQVLSEATVEIDGDRGTTSIPMETFVQGYAGEAYKLNFFLGGEFMGSRTIRLAGPSLSAVDRPM